MPDKKLLENGIAIALDKLYSNDQYLINQFNQSEKDHVSERSIVFRFGIYFNEYCIKNFSKYNLDVEYNRNCNDVKRLSDGEAVIPDIILHKRGNNSNNLLVLEFKTWWNSDQTKDKIKIKNFRDEKNGYNYQYGAVILIGKTRDEVKIEWI